METYQNILVVIDPTTENQKALKRAIDLATDKDSIKYILKVARRGSRDDEKGLVKELGKASKKKEKAFMEI